MTLGFFDDFNTCHPIFSNNSWHNIHILSSSGIYTKQMIMFLQNVILKMDDFALAKREFTFAIDLSYI